MFSGIALVEVGVNPASFFSTLEFHFVHTPYLAHPLVDGHRGSGRGDGAAVWVNTRFQCGHGLSVSVGTKQEEEQGIGIPTSPFDAWYPDHLLLIASSS